MIQYAAFARSRVDMSTRIIRRFGWSAFILMWIPFTAVFVGLFGMPEGDYAWGELPILSRYAILATGILFSISMAGLVGAPFVSWLRNRRVLINGQRGEAEVLAIWDTGMTVNQNPVVGLRLEVYPMAGAPFVAETEHLIPRLMVPQIQAGARLPVRCDPHSKSVALDIDG
jgi:hypothetical protein